MDLLRRGLLMGASGLALTKTLPFACIARAAAPLGRLRDLVLRAPKNSWIELPGTTLGRVPSTPRAAQLFLNNCGAAHDLDGHRSYFWSTNNSNVQNGPAGTNEVIMFDWEALTWTRLTDPSPVVAANGQYRTADGAPMPTISYDGLVFCPLDGNVYAWTSGSFPGPESGVYDLWKFNPAKRAWTFVQHLPFRENPGGSSAKWSAEFKKIFWYAPAAGVAAWFDPATGSYGALGGRAPGTNLSAGAIDDVGGKYYFVCASLISIPLASATPPAHSDVTHFGADSPRDAIAIFGYYKGVIFDSKRSMLTLWDGSPEVYAYRPSDGTYWQYPITGDGPANGRPNSDGRPLSKWWYVRELDIFLGFDNISQGVWAFVPGEPNQLHPEIGAVTVRHRDGTRHVYNSPSYAAKQLRDGDIVTIAKGEYPDGMVIDKNDVTVEGDPGLKLAYGRSGLEGTPKSGTHIFGAVQEGGQAIVVINGNGCTLRRLEISGGLAGENCNAVRQSGQNLTIDTCWLHHNNMHFQSGGNTLATTIKNSLLEHTVFAEALSHGIYCGANSKGTAASLELIDSTVRDSNGYGHLVKSRALSTTIVGCVLAQLDGKSSRVIDVPDGGIVKIMKNVLEMGPNSDNAELIGLAMELYGDTYGYATAGAAADDSAGTDVPDQQFKITATATKGSNELSEVSAEDLARVREVLTGNQWTYIRSDANPQLWDNPIYHSGAALITGVAAGGVTVGHFGNDGPGACKATASGRATFTVYNFKANPARRHQTVIDGNICICDLGQNPHAWGRVALFLTRSPATVTFSNNQLVGNGKQPFAFWSFDTYHYRSGPPAPPPVPSNYPTSLGAGTGMDGGGNKVLASRSAAGLEQYPFLPHPPNA